MWTHGVTHGRRSNQARLAASAKEQIFSEFETIIWSPMITPVEQKHARRSSAVAGACNVHMPGSGLGRCEGVVD